MIFLLSMIFAFALIALATIAMTILALCFVRWLLVPGQVQAPGDTFVDEQAPAFSRHFVVQ